MRNIAIAALTLLAACGFTEDSFFDAFQDETVRVAELCAEDDSDISVDDVENDDRTPCATFDAEAAKSCIDGMKEIDSCPDSFDFYPASCADVCTFSDSDSDA